MSKITTTLIDVSNEVLALSAKDSSWVNPTNTGTVPKGLITENNAAKANKNISMFFLQSYSTRHL